MYVGRDGEGAPKYRYFSTQPTKAEADAVLADALAARNQGAYVKPSKMTVSELLDRWLAHMEPRRPKSYGWYKYVVESHLKPGLGHIRLQDLAAMDIDDHYARELKQGRQANNWGRKKGERLSAASVHAQHRVLRAALRQAVRWRLMTLNPLDQATPPEPGRKEHRAQIGRADV